MPIDRPLTDAKLRGDRPVRLARGDQPEDLHLAAGQAGGPTTRHGTVGRSGTGQDAVQQRQIRHGPQAIEDRPSGLEFEGGPLQVTELAHRLSDPDPYPRRLVRRIEVVPHGRRPAECDQRRPRVSLEQRHEAFGPRHDPGQERSIDGGGDPGQFVEGGPRGAPIARCQRDLDGRLQQPDAPEWVERLVQRTTHDRRGAIDVALGQSEQGQAWLPSASPLVRLPVGVIRFGELTLQSMQFGALVDGLADGGFGWRPGQPVASRHDLLDRLGPGAVELQQLGSIDEASSAERDEIRLRVQPGLQCRRPFLRPMQVEDRLEGLDRGAVDRPDHDRPDFACRDRHERLVEQCDATRDIRLVDQRHASPETAQRREISVPEPRGDAGGTLEALECGHEVALVERAQTLRHEDEPGLDAIELVVLDDPRRTVHPAATAGGLPTLQQGHPDPERVSSGRRKIAGVERRVVGASPQVDGCGLPADQHGSRAGALEIRGIKRRFAIGLDEGLVRVSPCPGGVRGSSPRPGIRAVHQVSLQRARSPTTAASRAYSQPRRRK